MFNAIEGMTWLLPWLRERVFTAMWWLVPLALVISLANGMRDWFVRALVALWTLIVLRLWDDLEDLPHDRLLHPERALCRTASSTQAYACCIAGLAISGALITAAGRWGIVFVAVLPLLFVVTRLRRRSGDSWRIIWAQLILLKVPALLVALATNGVSPNQLWVSACALFGFVGAYEVLHDAQARRSSHAPIVFLMNIFCVLLGLATKIMQEIGT